MISVKECGAIGNGVADDTEAIQMAVDIAKSRLRGIQLIGGSSQCGCDDVYFPPGIYRVTSAITLSSYHRMIGEMAVVRADDLVSTIFLFWNCWRNLVRGIHFCGGIRHLGFENSNTDMTELRVESCTFQRWSEMAIQAAPYRGSDHLSATLLIRDCVFDGGEIVETWCDTTIVESCRHQLRGNLAPGVASMRNCYSGGTLSVIQFTGVPSVVSLAGNATWVENRGSLNVVRSRFGGEFGGIPCVLDRGDPVLVNPWIGRSISIRDSLTCAGQDSWSQSAVLTLAGIPQSVIIEGNGGVTSNSVPIVRVEPSYKFAVAAAAVQLSAKPSLPMYSMSVRNNRYLTPVLVPSDVSKFYQGT